MRVRSSLVVFAIVALSPAAIWSSRSGSASRTFAQICSEITLPSA